MQVSVRFTCTVQKNYDDVHIVIILLASKSDSSRKDLSATAGMTESLVGIVLVEILLFFIPMGVDI